MIDRIVSTPASTAATAVTVTAAAANTDLMSSAIPIVEMPILFFNAYGDVFVLTLGNLFFLLVSIASIAGVGISIFKTMRSKPKRST